MYGKGPGVLVVIHNIEYSQSRHRITMATSEGNGEFERKWCDTCQSRLPQIEAELLQLKKDFILNNQAELENRIKNDRAVLFKQVADQRLEMEKANEASTASIHARLVALHEKEKQVNDLFSEFRQTSKLFDNLVDLQTKVAELIQVKAALEAHILTMQSEITNSTLTAQQWIQDANNQLQLLQQRQSESMQYGLYEALKTADGTIALLDKGFTWVSLKDMELNSSTEAVGNETITGKRFLMTKRMHGARSPDTGRFEYWCTVGDYTMIAYSAEELF